MGTAGSQSSSHSDPSVHSAGVLGLDVDWVLMCMLRRTVLAMVIQEHVCTYVHVYSTYVRILVSQRKQLLQCPFSSCILLQKYVLCLFARYLFVVVRGSNYVVAEYNGFCHSPYCSSS